MLIEFSVKNFKSIKNKVTLTMQASADNTISKNIAKIKLPQIDGKKTLYRILKTSVIYGANASGKSNLFKAMDTIRQIIISSNFYHPNQEIPIDNFRLDMKCISQPTELGTMYSKDELEQLRQICDDYDLYLFMDGARLGYGLAADPSLTLKDYVKYCDVFYIGLTKCGGGFGEAVVFKDETVCPHFRSYMKQGGAMLAKGRLLGVQALTLFEDNHYQHICAHALKLADRIKNALKQSNIPVLIDSPTNQIFPIVTTKQREIIESKYVVSRWSDLDADRHVLRIVTSWGTCEEAVDALVETIRSLNE